MEMQIDNLWAGICISSGCPRSISSLQSRTLVIDSQCERVSLGGKQVMALPDFFFFFKFWDLHVIFFFFKERSELEI